VRHGGPWLLSFEPAARASAVRFARLLRTGEIIWKICSHICRGPPSCCTQRGKLSMAGTSRTGLYLIIDGKIKVSRLADNGHQVVVDIYRVDEFFGESALLNLGGLNEQAMAFDKAKLMTWTASEIQNIILKRPRIGLAMLQMLVQREMDFGQRIKTFSLDNLACRLAWSLIRFSERLGCARRRRYGAHGPVDAPVACGIRGHIARDHFALHGTVPETRISALFAQVHRSLPRRVQTVVASEQRLRGSACSLVWNHLAAALCRIIVAHLAASTNCRPFSRPVHQETFTVFTRANTTARLPPVPSRAVTPRVAGGLRMLGRAADRM